MVVVDAMLAGHSHGGQVRIPGITASFLPVMGRRYVRGMYQVGDVQLYVNRGIGAVHLAHPVPLPTGDHAVHAGARGLKV